MDKNNPTKLKNSLPLLEPQSIYPILIDKNWTELVSLLYKYSAVVPSDAVLEAVFSTVEQEIYRDFSSFKENKDFGINLRSLYLSHQIRPLSKIDVNFLILELVKFHDEKNDLDKARNYALELPDHDLCKAVIRKYDQSLPKKINHSQAQKISVTENKNIFVDDCTVSLFKSQQEYDFFMAFREAFPSFMSYPNVALSSLIDFDRVKDRLPKKERSYFFTAIIDCVVFDQNKDYKPVYFFELDSSFHDVPEQKEKDEMKDNILAISGQRLFRIRKWSVSTGQRDFIKLIRELINP